LWLKYLSFENFPKTRDNVNTPPAPLPGPGMGPVKVRGPDSSSLASWQINPPLKRAATNL